MGSVPWGYILALSAGAWLAGLGFGLLFGIKLPRRMIAWKQGIGFVVTGSFLVGLVLVLFEVYGKRSP